MNGFRRALPTLCLLGTLAIASGPGSVFAAPPALPIFPPLVFHPPKPERVVLDNGLVVYFLEDHELPLIKLSLMVRAGSQYETLDKLGEGGIFGSAMTLGGSASHTPEEIEKLLDKTAGTIDFGVDIESASGDMACQSKDFDTVFGLFADLLLHPQFRKDQVELAKGKAQEDLRRLNDDPEDMARREFRRLLYGTEHPYSRIPSPDTIRAITRNDLLAMHARYFIPNQTWIALSGDFDTADMKKKITQALGGWSKQTPSLGIPLPVPPAPTTSRLFYIERPINQTQVRIGELGFERHNPDHFAWEIFNELWGGSGTSKLFRTVRTEQGLAYSVASAYSEPAQRGLIVAVSQTRGPETIAAVQSMLTIENDVRSAPFTIAEIDRAKESLRNRFIEHYQSSSQIVGEVMSEDYFGYPADYLDTYTEHLLQVTPDDLKRVAKTYLHPEANTILIVGDLSTFDKPLSTLGHPEEVKPLDYSVDQP